MTVHAPVPEQPPPDHPANEEPALAVALSVTLPPTAYGWLQLVPHVIRPSPETTVPDPEPAFSTLSVCDGPTVTCAWLVASEDPLHAIVCPVNT